MANDFKAAAERKKKMAQTRRAKEVIGRMSEFLNEKEALLGEEDKAALQSSVDSLNSIIQDSDVDLDKVISANDEAEELLQNITEKVNNTPEPEAPAAEAEAPAENDELPAKEMTAETEEPPAEKKEDAAE